jgi:hypothetical protein
MKKREEKQIKKSHEKEKERELEDYSDLNLYNK